MKHSILGAVFIGILLFFVSGCGGGGGGDLQTSDSKNPVVYIGGNVTDGTNYTPCYWVGTQRCDLPGVSTDSNVAAIFAAGDTVYAAGYYYNGKLTPCYWVGNTKYDLPFQSGYTQGYAQSIYVSGGTVYVAGYYGDGSKKTPCYWVNGVCQDLTIPDTSSDAWATGIYVSGSTIYIAGSATAGGTIDYPCYWSGAHPLTSGGMVLANTNGGGAGGIYVSGTGSVYIAGCDRNPGNSPCYWVDGLRQPITVIDGDSNVVANGIDVTDNGTVYTCGYGSIPCYWVGTTPNQLQHPTGGSDGTVAGIYVKNGTVYTTGSYYNGTKFIACYWQGSACVQLSPEQSSGDAYSIFVK